MSNAALFNQAHALHRAGRRDEAETLYLQAIEADPRDFAARAMFGVLRLEQGRNDDAAEVLRAAIAIDPRPVQGHANYALALMRLERFDEAAAAFASALERAPGSVDLLVNRAVALMKLNRVEEALKAYDEALARAPDLAEAHYNRANALQAAEHWQEAVAGYERALSLRPGHAATLRNRAVALIRLKRYGEAAKDFAAALESAPGHPDAVVGLAQCAAHACDWRRRDDHIAAMRALIEGGTPVSPLTVLAHFDDPALQLKNAALFAPRATRPAPARRAKGGKVRLAYLSGDFRDHPVSRVAVNLFERHDRAAFEVFGISYGADDGSTLRKRTAAAFDEFHDVSRRSDAEAAALIEKLEIDILVDLGGYTAGARPGILAHRPAPVQVNWLGYPGTMGADFIDYIIADPVIAPLEQQAFYAEEIVHLPCYMPHDTTRPRPTQAPARAALGLPERGFVFAGFHNPFKITPEIFAVWMRLLPAVDGSVLWLAECNDEATANLRREAEARGVDPARLIFSPRVPTDEEHLARYLVADVFLDTAPYGAHSTAMDALWMGTPVVTIRGESFAGRVAASLCSEAGAPDLVAADLAAYEALARDTKRLATLKTKLKRDLPLFDSDAFCRALENIYRAF